MTAPASRSTATVNPRIRITPRRTKPYAAAATASTTHATTLKPFGSLCSVTSIAKKTVAIRTTSAAGFSVTVAGVWPQPLVLEASQRAPSIT